MSDICLVCVKNNKVNVGSADSLKARATLSSCATINIQGSGNIKPVTSNTILTQSKLFGIGSLNTKTNLRNGLFALKGGGVFSIKGKIKTNNSVRVGIGSTSNIKVSKVDKFAGSIDRIKSLENFIPTQKLYPIKDIITNYDNKYFVDKILNTTNLYSNIDDGIFTGNYIEHGKSSSLISDDRDTYIQPSSIFTSGQFRYKFEVTKPYSIQESFLFIRATAPLYNNDSRTSPEYTISNIKLEDPSGNLIIQYKDIVIRGDADYNTDYTNFTTYITEPLVNNLIYNTWDEKYPLMYFSSGYSLNLDVGVKSLDDAFSEHFDDGYEESQVLKALNDTNKNNYLSLSSSPISTHGQSISINPTNSLRISAIEICNSGGIGVFLSEYLSFYSQVDPTGQRIVRSIYPQQVIINSNNLDLYPISTFSTWESSPDFLNNETAYNTSVSGSEILTSKLQDDYPFNYIKLASTDPINDSGRLTLKFSHTPPRSTISLTAGSFSFGERANDFDTAAYQATAEADSFFVIDNISLKVIAKKEVGSRDYALDIIGYSDDGILNITPKIGTFLQNSDAGEGTIPISSGFITIDDLGISTQSFSEKNQYFNSALVTQQAGDHYKLASLPIVSGTTFAEYNIPLTIYKDNVRLGQPIDYSMSSYFENLYLDIYPLPSGATISTVQLIVTYKPSNGLSLHTLGQPLTNNLEKRNVRIYPISRNSNDDAINSDLDDGPLSLIENIPHAYQTPNSIKTNYARRWRGIDGLVVGGPYDPNIFDISFENPPLSTPFLDGYFTFNYDSGNNIISNPIANYSTISGSLIGHYNKISNIGLRFNNNSLFYSSTNYSTIDWTSINGYENHELYGKIVDAYDNVIRLSGDAGYINFGNIDTASGFSIYVRFSPDINISGIDYNLFNSGVIFSKWDSDKNLEFACGYEGGFLCGYARSDSGEIIKVKDTISYSGYQYPLSVLLTYNDNLSNVLRLYTNNEIISEPFNTLRASSSEFTIYSGISDLTFGFSSGSGVGINAFIGEIGISTYNASGTNLVYDKANKLYRQQNVDEFIKSQRHIFDSNINISAGDKFSLWDYINEDTSNWNLGQFKYYGFSADFSRFTKRDGLDFIEHKLKHSGSGYLQHTNITLPSTINTSGLAYHSQVENDFLRFNLSDVSESSGFYSTYPRISKNIPRGYNFNERSLVVETIIEHEALGNITWSDDLTGPKLIVSLYTKNQEPVDRPSKINWGLINRSIHNVKQSGIYKIYSTFNPKDIFDTSEPWANFDLETLKLELNHKYYSKDINDMFLQYDLSYPSGNPFDSSVKIHSSHIRLENALLKEQSILNNINLVCSGNFSARSTLELVVGGLGPLLAIQRLFTIGDYVPLSSGILSMYCSGANVSYASLNLHQTTLENTYQNLPIYVGGRSNKFSDSILPLITTNLVASQTEINSFDLFTKTILAPTIYDSSLNLSILARQEFVSFYPNSSMPLFTYYSPLQPISSGVFNLYVSGLGLLETSNSSVNLFTINYPAYNQTSTTQNTITWSKANVGKNIDSFDNDRAFLEANDEIRGVDIICYGSCSGDNPCVERSVTLHETEWYNDNQCFDGGIFRAKNTYTNLGVSGFKTDVGYSGHFYGIYKYDGLIPNAPYNIIIEAKTGSNESIQLPTEFTEVEYGSNDIINYSGIKFAPSGNDRRQGDKYGYSVAIKKNVLAVGSPKHTLIYQENGSDYSLEDAGSVFIYKRQDRPSGYNWPSGEHKSAWSLDTKLTLPSGLIKDFYTSESVNQIGDINLLFPITKRYWKVGQQGRQFGHSLDLAISDSGQASFCENDRQILVVGGPTAKWTSSLSGVGENAVLTNDRDFEEFNVSGIQIGLMIFTDEFKESTIKYINENGYPLFNTYDDIIKSIQNKDLAFQFFSDPPVKFDVKVLVNQPVSEYSNRDIKAPSSSLPSFITVNNIPRNQGQINQQQTQKIFDAMVENFHKSFPYDDTKLNNNIPVILGLYVDSSLSLGRSAITPALDEFTQYYKEYSFASGLRDFYNVRSSGICIEYQSNDAEDWIQMSKTILDVVLDTGRLLRDNQVRFFSSGIGQEYFNTNLSMFNFPPESGGKVYIFEKESGNWNLIQQITSPNITYNTPDRFGHAVAISDNTEIISIGSPYINSTCNIYEYKPSEKDKFYSLLPSWLSYKSSATGGFGYYANLISDFSNWANSYGYEYALKILYSTLSPTDKYEAREYLGIQEYQNIFTYNNPTYTKNKWSFVLDKFIPTSRLGYSTAVNEDGSIVAFGAPTDSLNQWDDAQVYYKNGGYYNKLEPSLNTNIIPASWSSNVNAGAVRIFESRKYYPHSKVIEYGKFGNLQKSLNLPEDSGHFNYLASIFNNKNFTVTPFSQVDIPQDVGLAFIITPEIDALSNEVADNIINWLALGDRNLVLVGNDPIWESSGIYANSNNIINKILDRLDSRMKLYPARNQYEAMVSGCSKAIPSVIPENSTQSYTTPYEVNIHGVADIRTNFDKLPLFKNLNLTMPCSFMFTDLNDSTIEVSPNDRCQLPIRNNGDLRAEYIIACQQQDLKISSYNVNIPYLFKTHNPNPCNEDITYASEYRLDLQNQEPVPLLAAADIVNETVIIPAKPASSGIRDITETTFIESNTPTITTLFDYDNIGNSSIFIWDHANSGYSNLISNINLSSSINTFYEPDLFENRQSLLQANAIPQQNIVKNNIEILSNLIYCVEENYSNTSKIVGIAQTFSESEDTLYNDDINIRDYDRNMNFYLNLVYNSEYEKSSIAQLGGWTGRTSFLDANEKSILHELFLNDGHYVSLNIDKPYNYHNICWIANPKYLPSNQDILNIKSWLNTGNKKLIITHDSTDAQARIVNKILNLLDSNIELSYDDFSGKFIESNNVSTLTFNGEHPVSTGRNAFSSIQTLRLASFISYIPFKDNGKVTNICGKPNQKTYVTQLETAGYWRMDTGITKVTFPVVGGSGYRLFIDTISENPSETESIEFYINNVSSNPNLPDASITELPKSISSIDNNKYDLKFSLYHNATAGSINSIQSKHFDIQTANNVSEIDIYITNTNDRLNNVTSDYIPKTTRLISISGVSLPIINKVINNPNRVEITKIVGREYFSRDDAKPEVIINTSRFTHISNINNSYCVGNDCEKMGLSNKLVADGPVVAAQEVEHISSFSAGFARSRITLLSDASLVQGKCVSNSTFQISANTLNFIRSLYPTTNFSNTNSGRQFNVLTKIISPERGSSAKYFSSYENSGINSLFGGTMGTYFQSPLSSFTSNDSQYDPKYVLPTGLPWESDGIPLEIYSADEIKQFQQNEINTFASLQYGAGSTSKFSGIIEGKMYQDASIYGGIPEIMKDTGYDYLDFDRFPSGYPGDLFGYSIALYKNKLIIGSPFCAFSQEDIKDWSYYQNGGINSGIKLSHNGGAGSVYIFEQTFNGSGLHGSKTPWEFTQKLRPESINVGQDLTDSGISQQQTLLGNNNYTNEYLANNTIIGDKFGIDVDIDGDIIIVGAPGHDFDNYYLNGSGQFIRKDFNSEFNIPSRSIYDMGSSGNRDQLQNSGICILNNGAIFAFENKIVNWNDRSKKWKLIEKIIPQGYNSAYQALPSGSENSNFGYSISIDKANRSDADYSLSAGSHKHIYSTNSGEIALIDAGAAYSNDIMLRNQPPSIPSALAYIVANVFGEKGLNSINISVVNNGDNNLSYYATGLLYSDNKGQIFLEASGQNPSDRHFIQHSPYIVSVDGKYAYGTMVGDGAMLFIDGKQDSSQNMNIFTNVDNLAFVYNNMGLYSSSIIGFASGIIPSGLTLYSHSPDPIEISESGLSLYTSGIGHLADNINLRIRGR
jgi:hypothetical protein